MKNSLRLLHSVLHWFQSARRVQPEKHGSRELLRKALADMLADPETRRFLLRELLGAGIPMEGGNPTTAAQNVCPGTFGVNCSPGDYAFNSKLGIGVTTPAVPLHVLSTTEQLRLAYSASQYASFTVDIAGNLTIQPQGGTVTAGNILSVGIGTGGDIRFNNSARSALREVTAAAAQLGKDYNLLYLDPTAGASPRNVYFFGAANAADIKAVFQSSGNVGIGTTSPAEKLDVAGNIKSKGLNQIVFLAPLSPVGDDGAAINNAISNLISANPNGGIIMLAPGTYNIQTTIAINYGGVKLRGYGGLGLNGFTPLTYLKRATGAGPQIMVDVKAPLGQVVQDIELCDLTIDGIRTDGTTGLRLRGVKSSLFRGLYVVFVNTGIELTAEVGAGANGCSFNLFEHCSIRAETQSLPPLTVTSKALVLGSVQAPNQLFNASQNTFVDLSVAYAGGANDVGIDLEDCDNNAFYRTWMQQTVGTQGVGVLINLQSVTPPPPDPPIARARANYFYHLEAAGGVSVINAPPISGYNKNMIFGYDLENYKKAPTSSDGNPERYVFWIDSNGAAHGEAFQAMLAPATLTPPVEGNFTWGNKDNATTAVANSGGALWVSTETAGPNLQFLFKTAPATPTPWSVVIGVVVMQGSQSVTRAGLAIRDPSNQRLQTLMVGYESAPTRQVIRNDNWQGYTSFSLNNVLIAFPYLPGITWLKVSDDGTNRFWYISADGQSWIEVFRSGNTSWVNDSQCQVGFVLDENDSNRFNGALWVHWAGL